MEDIKDIVLEYVKEEYLEDEDEELTYETPLISYFRWDRGFLFHGISQAFSGDEVQHLYPRRKSNTRGL